MTLFPRVRELMDDAGVGHVLLTGGGVIPAGDREELERSGTGRIFGPGTPTGELADYIRTEVGRRRAAE
jgi:methylmalonyl-CoA mutase C-terminal domain/subunit